MLYNQRRVSVKDALLFYNFSQSPQKMIELIHKISYNDSGRISQIKNRMEG